MTNNTTQEIPIACDLTAIPLTEREQHVTEGIQIMRAVVEAQELPNGYAFRFANEPGVFMALANFVEIDRLCCPFFSFVIEVEPGHGPLWLRLTGGEGVKEFAKVAFADANEAIRQKLIITGPDSNLDEAVVESVNAMAEAIGKASPQE